MEKAKKIIGLILISIGITTAVVFWIMFGFSMILDTTVWDGLNSIRIEISWAILLGFTILSGAILLSGTSKE
jgi:hypothetical protein